MVPGLSEDALLAFKSRHTMNPPLITLPQHHRLQFLRTQALSPLYLNSIRKEISCIECLLGFDKWNKSVGTGSFILTI